jgi:hypothetical protein
MAAACQRVARTIVVRAKMLENVPLRDGTRAALRSRMRWSLSFGAVLCAISACALVSARDARAGSPRRHLVRVDVMEMVVGRTPRTRHFDFFVTDDGALAQTHVGLYTVGARWSDRQEGKPMMTLTLDRVGSSPMHSTTRYRPTLGAPSLRFGSGSKAMLTEVIVTVT